jgi:ribosomal protein L37AE/L43A
MGMEDGMNHMLCEKCGSERLVLFRSNPRGEKGVWWCEECMRGVQDGIDIEVREDDT